MKFRLPKTLLSLLVVGMAAKGSAATWVGTTNGSWNTTTNWSDNVAPNGTITYSGTVSNPTQTLDGNWSIDGIVFSASNAVTLNKGTGTTLTLGAGGIDMSLASANFSLGTTSPNLVIGANQTWTVKGGLTLTSIKGDVSTASGTGNINMVQSGTGVANIVFNQNGNGTGWTNYSGAITVNSNVKVQSQGNDRQAFGSGRITLAGGTISQNSGNWTWNNNIDVTAASVIGNDSTNGLGRTLKLTGNLTSSNGSGLTFTNTTTGGTRNDDTGFILAGVGSSTYGSTTISANTRVRVGGNGTLTVAGDGYNAGTRGSLGTGDVTLVDSTSELAFTRTDAHTVANKITGLGTVQIGGTTTAQAGTSTQVVTLSGASTYTGVTTVKNGALNLTGSLTSSISVASGAALGGSGSTTGDINLSAGSAITLNSSGSVQGANINVNGATALILKDYVIGSPQKIDVLRYTGTVANLSNFTATSYRNGLVSDDSVAKKITLDYLAETRTWSGVGGNWDVGSSASWAAGGSDQMFYWGDAVSFGDIASNQTVTLVGNLSPSSLSVSNSANSYTFAGSGALIGSSGLTKSGSGTLYINNSGLNTYSGSVALQGGVLQVGVASGLGKASSVVVSSGALLRYGNSANAAFTSSGHSVTLNDGAQLSIQGGSNATVLSVADNIVLNSSVTAAKLGGFLYGNSAVFSGSISGVGNLQITAFDGGSNGGTFLNGWKNNQYVGNTAISGLGVLTFQLGSVVNNDHYTPFGQVLGSTSGTATISGGQSIIFKMPGVNDNVYIDNNLVLDNATITSEDSQFHLAGNVHIGAGGAALRAHWDSKSLYVDGLLTGSGAIAISTSNNNTSGVRFTNGSNTYSGVLSVSSSNAMLGHNTALQFATINIASNNGLQFGAGVTAPVIGGLSGNGNNSIAGVTLTVGGTNSSTSYSGVLSGAGALVKTGSGALSLSGANTYTGNTTISGGVLNLTGTGSIYNGNTKSGANSLVINGGAVLVGDRWAWGDGNSLGRLNYNDGYISVNNGTIRNTAATSTSFQNRGVAVGSGGMILENATAGTTWTIDAPSGGNNNASSFAANAKLTLSGAGDGNFQQVVSGANAGVNVEKTGSGSWTLSGNNTYTGGTTVTSGTLVAGSATALGTGAVTVNGGTLNLNGQALGNNITLAGGKLQGATASYTGAITATAGAAISGSYTSFSTGSNPLASFDTTGGLSVGALTGQGTFSGGLVTVSGAYTPGNSPGTQTFTSGLSLTGATTLEIAADGSASDLVNVTGGLTLGGGATLSLSLFGTADYTSAFWDSNQSFTLINADSVTGSFASIDLVGLGSTSEGIWATTWEEGVFKANWTASSMPEPSSLGLFGLGMAGMLLRRRRKQA